MKKILFTISMIISITLGLFAQSNKLVYKNPEASVEDRIEDLLSRMTLEEKIAQLVGAASDDVKFTETITLHPD